MPRKKKEPVSDKQFEKSVQEIVSTIDKLYPLHPQQLILEEQVFVKKRKRIFAQCGRNWGKSVWIARTICKFASITKGAACYIVTPEKTQGKEIYWDSGLLLGMIPPDMIAVNFLGQDEVTKNDLRIRLKNGSFIKILGADDPKSLRGIKPHICAFDEYRDFKEEVYWSMEANLIGKSATLLIGSTPPDTVGSYSEIREHFIQQISKGNDNYYYLELPSEGNPHLDKEMLMDTKKRLYAHGKARVWEREYLAKFIPGGASSVFPMFAERKEHLVKSHFYVTELIRSMYSDLEFYCSFDPATSSVFAVLFVAINKYTGQYIVMDEIYERDRMSTISTEIWSRASKIKKLYCKKLSKWDNTYDEHEAWFERDIERGEVLEDGETLDATSKQSRDKEEDLSIFKDMMLVENCLIISEKCKWFIEEIESCTTDKNDKIVKKKDHNLDNNRYIIAKSEFSLIEKPDYDGYLKDHKGKYVPFSKTQEYEENKRKQEDWTHGLDESSLMFDDDEVISVEDISYAEMF